MYATPITVSYIIALTSITGDMLSANNIKFLNSVIMKTEILECFLIEVGAMKDTVGIDKKNHISITGVFQERSQAGYHSGATSFSLNVRKDTNLGIFKALLKISHLAEDSPEREQAIDAYNSEITAINYMSERCPLYFTYNVINGKAKINQHASDHVTKANQPIVAGKVTDYWLVSKNADTAEDRFEDKKKAIGNYNMFVTPETAKDMMQHVKDEYTRKLMERAQEKFMKINDPEGTVPATEKEEVVDINKDDKSSDKKDAKTVDP